MKKKRKTKKLNNKNKKKKTYKKKTYKKNKANTLFQIKGGDGCGIIGNVSQNIIKKRDKIEQFIIEQSNDKVKPIVDKLIKPYDFKNKFRDYFTTDFQNFIGKYMCDTTYQNYFTRSTSSMNKKKIIFDKCFDANKFIPDAANKFPLSFSKYEIKNVFSHFF